MKNLFDCATYWYCKFFDCVERIFSPLWDVTIRAYVFCVFFISGWMKLQNALNGHWEITMQIYEREYTIPYLPANIAAVFGTFSELFFSTLLLVGFATRLSALMLIVMTAIIEFTFVRSIHHTLWAFLLFSLFVKGPGSLSIDSFVSRYMKDKYCKKNSNF